jgi:hypothetical protein
MLNPVYQPPKIQQIVSVDDIEREMLYAGNTSVPL